MHVLGRLGILWLFGSVLLHVLHVCDSQLMVNIEVRGKDVHQTGIRKYTISKYGSTDVTIKCTSPLTFPSRISLWKDNNSITEYSTSENGITIAEKRFHGSGEDLVGKYHCALNISNLLSNHSSFEFSVSSYVEIETPSTSLCASSIGDSGYVGERFDLECTNFDAEYYCYWEQPSGEDQTGFVTRNTFRRLCICGRFYKHYYNYFYYYYYQHEYYWKHQKEEQFCFPSTFSVFPFLNLNISFRPRIDVTRSNNSVMEFCCNSTPPRLMYWSVFGVHGNLLDIDNLRSTLKINVTVNITQSPGETSLRIWESVPGGNGIHTVICSTYDTEARVVALFRIQSQTKRNSDYEDSSLKPKNVHVTTYDNLISTAEGSSVSVRSTVEATRHSGDDSEVTPPKRGDEMTAARSSDYLFIGAVALPLLVIIFILLGTIFYMRYIIRHKTGLNSEVSAQCIPDETVLHDNPAYLVFTESKGCVDNNANVEMESDYVEL